MEQKYSSRLEKYRQIAQWYSEHSTLYKRQISIDIDLTMAAKPKMKALMEEFISRVNDFLKALESAKPVFARIDEGMYTETKDALEQFGTIEDEFNKISKTFEKLAVTTPKLLEIKRKIDEKIKLYENLQRKNSLTPSKMFSKESKTHISKTKDQQQDINNRWLDSLLQDVSQRSDKITKMGSSSIIKSEKKENGKIREEIRKDHSNIHERRESVTATIKETPKAKQTVRKDVSSYLTGFKIIQDELSEMRTEIKKLAQHQQEHKHEALEREMQKVNLCVMKVEADNNTIQKEHSELLHALHVLCIILVLASREPSQKIAKRVDLLETENEQLKELMGKISAKKGSPTASSMRMIAINEHSKVTQTIPASAVKASPSISDINDNVRASLD